jgi:hypothetical protein
MGGPAPDILPPDNICVSLLSDPRHRPALASGDVWELIVGPRAIGHLAAFNVRMNGKLATESCGWSEEFRFFAPESALFGLYRLIKGDIPAIWAG